MNHSHLTHRFLLISAVVLATSWCAAGSVAAATRWQWPLAGHPVVVRGFHPPATPYGPGHRGVDLAGSPGDQVFAAGAGLVGFAGILAGRGVISVAHRGGLRTTYEPVRPAVRPGQFVNGGAVLGILAAGHPGCPVAACLHWGLRRATIYLNPLALLRSAPVRLLPLGGSPMSSASRDAGGRSRASSEFRTATAADPRPSGPAEPLRRTGYAIAVGLAGLAGLAMTRRPP